MVHAITLRVLLQPARVRKNCHAIEMEQATKETVDDGTAEARSEFGLGTEIAALFHDIGMDEAVEELRGYEPRPAEFEDGWKTD